MEVQSLQKLKTMYEIKCIIGLIFFQISDLTFVASEFQIFLVMMHHLVYSAQVS